MSRLFGTDGVRGLANREVTARLALRLGEAAARVLTRDSSGSRKRAIIGRDTRVSGEFLANALAAGLSSAGVDVIDVGVLPTPGIAYLTSRLGVDLGVVISASHNPMPDNGIKFFSRSGLKLEDAIEDEIEGLMEDPWHRPIGADVGRITHNETNAADIYVHHLISSISTSEDDKPLKGLKVVLDAANGAASLVAPDALRLAGADVVVINASPDGYNINEACGSTHPEQLQATAKAVGADLGVAFDGDADRLIACDEKGELISGDKTIAILAKDLKDRDLLKNDSVVLTVMTNLGARNYFAEQSIEVKTTAVGDRYVLEKMLSDDITLGGEQSGHIINLNYSTTGDGTLSALLLADAFKRSSSKKISELADAIPTLPQVLINVPDVDKKRMDDPELVDAIKICEQNLGSDGRVLLRPSGTEPIVRVMVEAVTDEIANSTAQHLAKIVQKVGRV